VANPFSVSIELVGKASQSAEDWNTPFALAELALAADLTAHICRRWKVPLDFAENPRTDSGLCGHMDITKAWLVKGGHVDPGPNFPWEDFLAMCRAVELPSPT
jgi:N-acetyl-anhydromuramyl-L-alanine amidase AmpD